MNEESYILKCLKYKYISYLYGIYYIPELRNYFLFTEFEIVENNTKDKMLKLKVFIQQIMIDFSNYRFLFLSKKNNIQNVEDSEIKQTANEINLNFNNFKGFYDDNIEKYYEELITNQTMSQKIDDINKIKIQDIIKFIIDQLLTYTGNEDKLSNVCSFIFKGKNCNYNINEITTLISQVNGVKNKLNNNYYLFNSLIFRDEKDIYYTIRKNLLLQNEDEFEVIRSTNFLLENDKDNMIITSKNLKNLISSYYKCCLKFITFSKYKLN